MTWVEASLRVEIFPRDVAVTTAFYQRLGFHVAGLKEGPPRYASIRLASVRIGVCETEPIDPARGAHAAMTEMVIEVDDVRAARQRIVDQGVDLTEDLRSREWGLIDFGVTDPDGYYVRFTSRAPDQARRING